MSITGMVAIPIFVVKHVRHARYLGVSVWVLCMLSLSFTGHCGGSDQSGQFQVDLLLKTGNSWLTCYQSADGKHYRSHDHNVCLPLCQYFTDGTTNKLVGCYLDNSPEDVVLVRVYGNKTELIVDRDSELKSFQVEERRESSRM